MHMENKCSGFWKARAFYKGVCDLWCVLGWVLRRTSILVRLSLASPSSSSSQYAAAIHRRSLKRTHQSSLPSVPQQYQNLNLDPWTSSPSMTLISHRPHSSSSTTVITPQTHPHRNSVGLGHNTGRRKKKRMPS
jgi:hypothetical protein